MTKIKISSIASASAWCSKFISPRGYWLHNRLGGEGWYIEIEWKDKSVLTIEDEKTAILAILKFGDQL